MYVGTRQRVKRNSVWIWTAVVEEADGIRWVEFEVGGRDETAFLMRLYNRLPESDRYSTGAYEVYKWLPANRHVVGKGRKANRNEGLHSVLRSKLNRLVRKTKGLPRTAIRGLLKEPGDAARFHCISLLAFGIYLIPTHAENTNLTVF